MNNTLPPLPKEHILELGKITGDPTGFDRANPALMGDMSYDKSTRTFTIQPKGGESEFIFYFNGERRSYTSAQNVIHDDVAGMHFFYFDADSQLKTSYTIDLHDLYQFGYCAALYWNVTAQDSLCGSFFEERHGLIQSSQSHHQFHERIGTILEHGLTLNSIIPDDTGDIDTHAQYSINEGRVEDEDIGHDISTHAAPAQVHVIYKVGAEGYFTHDTITDFPVKSFAGGSGRASWNEFTGGSWQQTEVTNNDFVAMHLFAVGGYDFNFFIVQGQAKYNTTNAARQGVPTEIVSLKTNGLPSTEFVHIGSFIIQTSNSYSNTVKSRIVSDDNGNPYVPRIVTANQSVAPASHFDLTSVPGSGHHHLSEEQWTILLEAQELITLIGERTGYLPDLPDSTISWDDITRTFTISPVADSFLFYILNRKFIITDPTPVIISDVLGFHFIYFNSSGVLVDDPTPPPNNLLYGIVYTQAIYWSTTQQEAILVGEERHGMTMDWATHRYLHFSHGTKYVSGGLLSNFDIDGNGSANTHIQFSLTDSIIFDEDIKLDSINNAPQQISPILQAPVLYKDGITEEWRSSFGRRVWEATTAMTLTWRVVANEYIYECTTSGTTSGAEPTWPTTAVGDTVVDGTVTWTLAGNINYPVINDLATGRVAWNNPDAGGVGVWGLEAVPNNDFVSYHILHTNDLYNPIMILVGEHVYSTIGNARNTAKYELNHLSGFGLQEYVVIASIIVKTSTAMTSFAKAAIQNVGEDLDGDGNNDTHWFWPDEGDIRV